MDGMWQLFWETGHPLFYLHYSQSRQAEESKTA